MALKAGWEDARIGGSLVKNTQTGQVVDQNHPDYLNAADGPISAPGPMSVDPVAPPGPISAPGPMSVDPVAPPPPISAPGPMSVDPVGPAQAVAPAAPAQSPEQAAGIVDMGNNLVRLANGAMVDRNHPLYKQALAAAGGGGAAGAAGSGAGNGGNTPVTPSAGGAPTTIADAFRKGLIDKLGGGNPVDQNSPEISGAIAANKLAEQRGAERQRNILAEQNARDGTDASGGAVTDQLGIEQDRAAREGQFSGNAVMQLAQQRQSQIMQALALGGQYLSDQDKNALQKELADLDAQVRREGIAQQGALGSQDLSLRDKLGSGQLNLGLLSALMNNDQFGRQLSQNGAQFGAGLDQQGLLGLLGLL